MSRKVNASVQLRPFVPEGGGKSDLPTRIFTPAMVVPDSYPIPPEFRAAGNDPEPSSRPTSTPDDVLFWEGEILPNPFDPGADLGSFTVADWREAVGTDPVRARYALLLEETREAPRSSLVTWLGEILAAGDD